MLDKLVVIYAFREGSLKSDNVGMGGPTLNGISHENYRLFFTLLF